MISNIISLIAINLQLKRLVNEIYIPKLSHYSESFPAQQYMQLVRATTHTSDKKISMIQLYLDNASISVNQLTGDENQTTLFTNYRIIFFSKTKQFHHTLYQRKKVREYNKFTCNVKSLSSI